MRRNETDEERRNRVEKEIFAGAPPQGQDAQVIDEDFSALHRLANNYGAKLSGDSDVQRLRTLVNDHRRQRLHDALDKVLDCVQRRHCAGDRAFLRRVGVRP
jgi:hypothetical protein